MEKCEGTCCAKESQGPVFEVNVICGKSGYNWGNFYYCQEAIDIDRTQGFIVKKVS